MTAAIGGAIRWAVLEVHCRHCGERIPIDMAEGLAPDAQLRECERQSEEAHQCTKEAEK